MADHAAQPPTNTDADHDHAAPAQDVPRRSGLGRAWAIKMIGFGLLLFGLGVWGALDAYWIYPARGEKVIDQTEQAYLEQAREANQLLRASVPDPADEFERLERQADETGRLEPIERARLDWLTALSRLHSLDAIQARNARELERRDAGETPEPTRTVFADPRERLEALEQLNATRSQAKPLSAYDMPLQYVFMIGGLLGAGWMAALVVRVRGRVYTFDPGAHAITTPDNARIDPATLESVDKRKWDKFLVFVRLAGESDERKLDLYRHQPLEDWVLEVEKLCPWYEVDVDGETTLPCVDVATGAGERLTVDQKDQLPAVPESGGQPTLYPAARTAAGEWFVIGTHMRSRLAAAIAAGEIDASAVDRDTFRVVRGPVLELQDDELPERDARPALEPAAGEPTGSA